MTLWEYDQSLGIERFCGVDEAGRGPLAGDVYAAAVILDPSRPIDGLNDSKKLTEKKREALYPEIQEKALSWSVGIATVAEIEEYNILQATFLAMRRAVEGLSVPPSMALIDGNRDPKLGIPTRLLVKGDGTSAAIAAASIIAKVSRDHYMQQVDAAYPQYQFGKHKGYGTKLHYEMLDLYGESPVHRHSFLKSYYKQRQNTPAAGSKETGSRGEQLAADYLTQHGCEILARNWHCAYGELDLVARKEDLLLFVEVKTRSAGMIAVPAEAVTLSKRKKLTQAAQGYLLQNPLPLQPRFDILEIYLDANGNFTRAVWLENAFDAV
jgi:ribonuclease HII